MIFVISIFLCIFEHVDVVNCLHSQAILGQPLDSNIISQTKPLQASLQFVLCGAADSVEHYLSFATWALVRCCESPTFCDMLCSDFHWSKSDLSGSRGVVVNPG